jgi:hypothetical protein
MSSSGSGSGFGLAIGVLFLVILSNNNLSTRLLRYHAALDIPAASHGCCELMLFGFFLRPRLDFGFSDCSLSEIGWAGVG